MKPDKPTQRDGTIGEGDRVPIHHDYQQLREFVAGGQVSSVAREARSYVGQNREAVPGAVRRVPRGSQTQITLDEMIAKNRGILERVRPFVHRAVGRLRARFRQK
jgi:hypothetical protein